MGLPTASFGEKPCLKMSGAEPLKKSIIDLWPSQEYTGAPTHVSIHKNTHAHTYRGGGGRARTQIQCVAVYTGSNPQPGLPTPRPHSLTVHHFLLCNLLTLRALASVSLPCYAVSNPSLPGGPPSAHPSRFSSGRCFTGPYTNTSQSVLLIKSDLLGDQLVALPAHGLL